MSFEKFKEVAKEPKQQKKLFHKLDVDVDQIEINKLYEKDLSMVLEFLLKRGVETNEQEVLSILKEHTSFGAFVNRDLSAVILSWRVSFNEHKLEISEGDDSLNFSEVVVHFTQEGKQLRERLIRAVEKEALANDLNYVVCTLEDSSLETRMKKALKNLNYSFAKDDSLLLAFKKI